MMTNETMARARDYAQTMRDKEVSAYVVAVRTRANGYEPNDRRYATFNGHAVDTFNATGSRTIVVWPEGLRDARTAMYIIDDGETTQSFYVAGWSQSEDGPIFLNPIPADHMGDEAIQRADGRGPVDYSTWMLPASRAYHVKLSRRIPALAAFNGTHGSDA